MIINNRIDEKKISVRDHAIAIKSWHSSEAHPVIALHGFLDNAASFDFLAPLLDKYHVISFDQAGNGHSDFRSPSSHYHLWDDLLDILSLMASLHLEKITLIGHSRGATLALLFAANFPEKVDKVILLDGLLPPPVEDQDCLKQMRGFLTQHHSLNKKPRYYPYFDDWVLRRMQINSISQEAAIALAERSVKQNEEGYCWHYDPKIKMPSVLKLNKSQVDFILQSIDLPVHLIYASEGIMNNTSMKSMMSLCNKQFTISEVEGHHHFHMQPVVEEIAKLCLDSF